MFIFLRNVFTTRIDIEACMLYTQSQLHRFLPTLFFSSHDWLITFVQPSQNFGHKLNHKGNLNELWSQFSCQKFVAICPPSCSWWHRQHMTEITEFARGQRESTDWVEKLNPLEVRQLLGPWSGAPRITTNRLHRLSPGKSCSKYK